jgi:hypothetical protein
VNESLLKAYIREALITELRRDEKFIAMLKGSGMDPRQASQNQNSDRVANQWITDMELELGKPLRNNVKANVRKFVASRWQGMVARFRGDPRAAQHTMTNVLDSKFNQLRTD